MKKKRLIAGCVLLCVLFLIGVGVYINRGHTAQEEQEQQLQERVDKENSEKLERASDNENPAIIVSNAQAKPGDTVTLTVSVVNNPGILGMTLSLFFDDTMVKLIGVEGKEAFEDVLNLSYSKNLESGCVFLWDGESLTEDQVKDGEILNLEFQVLEDAPEEKTQIVLIGDENGIVDQNLDVVNPVIENGFITIAK